MARRKKITQKEVAEGYRRLAFGDVQSAIKLLFESDEAVLTSLDSYDLFNVSEVKKAKGGVMEIKFFDRLKALEKLNELALAGEQKAAGSFLEALEKSAKMAQSGFGDDAIE